MTVKLPQYKCHKIVGAVQILDLIPVKHAPCEHPVGKTTCGYPPNEVMHNGSSLPFIPPDGRHDYTVSGDKEMDINIAGHIIHNIEGLAPIAVSHEYVERCRPQIGGYFVVYEDSYESYSPAKAFEDGYTRIVA